MRIAVAGGTGLVGQLLVTAARRDGHEVRVLSRGSGVDLTDATGLDGVLSGVETVVDVSNVSTTTARTSTAFFGAVTGNLLDAANTAGVRHLVVLSIVGVDRVPGGYYAGKVHQERLVTAGAVPWTIQRATQFHEFAGQLLDRMPGPVALVPRWPTAPVAAQEVAARLLELAVGSAMGRAAELAGPEVHVLSDLARRVARARGERRLVLGVPVPGATGRAAARGGLLPSGDDVVRGRQTFGDWLHAS